MAGPATMVLMSAGDAQTVSAGGTVAVKPCVRVVDADGQSVAGFHVYFDVASGGGSITGADAVSDASGIATVGSWTLGGVAGVNTLTATAYGLTGSPVTFTATGSAGILLVKQAGVAIRSYTLAELQALTPFTGIAGYYKGPVPPAVVGTVTGPDAVTGVKVADIIKDALGTPLAATQSVEVTNYVPLPASPFTKTFTQAKLVNLTGVAFYNATTKLLVPDNATLTGPLAAVIVYSDPAGVVMPTAKGPLRFFFASGSAADNVVMSPSSDSVGTVNQLNVIPTP